MLKQYLRQHRKVVAAYLLFCVIFVVSFCLYDLPLGAVGYPALLCAVSGGVLLWLDYRKAAEKHRYMQKLQDLSVSLLERLPKTETVEDTDYRRIIELLCREQAQQSAVREQQYADMVDYYTVWAHQIKTPIASMRLHLQNEDSALSRQLMLDLSRIEQYVEMVLAFLRLDSDSTDYVFRSCPLDDIIRGAVRKFSGEFISRKLRLQFTPTEKVIVTDEKWLSFVLEQLISNALKYTRKGGISIAMEGEELVIRDTGIGIAAQDLPRIFDRGYTGFNGRADRRASGIGLYLCRRVCHNLGIGIRAVSAPDEGTAVYLDLQQEKVQE